MSYVIIIYATTFMRLITLKNKNKNDIIFVELRFFFSM